MAFDPTTAAAHDSDVVLRTLRGRCGSRNRGGGSRARAAFHGRDGSLAGALVSGRGSVTWRCRGINGPHLHGAPLAPAMGSLDLCLDLAIHRDNSGSRGFSRDDPVLADATGGNHLARRGGFPRVAAFLVSRRRSLLLPRETGPWRLVCPPLTRRNLQFQLCAAARIEQREAPSQD